MPKNLVIFQEVPAYEETTLMTTENDVPLGDGSQRYYEQLFDERIRKIDKERSARQIDKGGSNGNGRLGCGVLFAVFILIRIVSTFLNSHSHTSMHSPPPPAPPAFRFQQPIIIEDPGINAREDDERQLFDPLRPGKDVAEDKPLRVKPKSRAPDGAKR